MIKVSIGLFLLFVGLFLFTSGLRSFVDKEWLNAVTPLAMLFCCLGFTAVFQSSSLTTIILAGMVASKVIPLNVAIAGVIGANIGTCVTVLIVSCPIGLQAKRLAMAHLVFNVGAAIPAYLLIKKIEQFCRLAIN